MSMLSDFNYSDCSFQARLQKPTMFRFRKNQEFYLYVSKDFMIINRQPYSKKPQIILKLLPTTHVKWLWENKKARYQLKGFIIQTEGYMNQFIAQKVVLQTLKIKFKQITLQSDFYDEYILGQYIDKGNYAQVYQCIKKDKHQKFAVKILQKQRLKSMKNGKQSVFNELKILRNLKHQNLMRLFQVFQDRNKYYFVLQLLEGTTLYKEIQNRKKKQEMKPHQIRGILKQILEGLKFLHSSNIMHRDIKPENILFDQKTSLDEGDGSKGLKLVDYGLATFQHEKNIIFTKCGTPGFVAPEVINYDEKEPIYSLNVDIFSVGVILHILLVGEQSFPGRSRNTILNKNKECRIDFKSKKYEAIASDGIDLLSKMLEKTSQKRISAEQALNHPFLTTDKPIFKFKKITKSEPQTTKNVTMRMVHNFEEIEQENSYSPLKQSKVGSYMQSKSSFFSPFSFDHQSIDSTLLLNADAQNKQIVKRKLNKTLGPSLIQNPDNYFNYS